MTANTANNLINLLVAVPLRSRWFQPMRWAATSVFLLGLGCAASPPQSVPSDSSMPQSSASSPQAASTQYADVLSVAVTGSANAYQFAVTVQSPDTGCDQYADWWEVVSESGELIHRRVLLHSHVTEQPFTRSSRPVAIAPTQSVIIRAHMHPDGYGGQALQGNVADGFDIATLPEGFGADLAQQPPLPSGCQF